MNAFASTPTLSPGTAREQGRLLPAVKFASRHPARPRTARAPGGIGLRYLRIASPDEKMGPVPLVIGVTGHLDVHEAQREQLEARVNRIFSEARAECRYTPLLLLTALAEGADLLAARVALREKVPLAVVLPMEKERYEQGFRTPGALEEFRRCYDQADAVHLAYGEDDPYHSGDYSNAGAYIVANCDLLVALWDGEEQSGREGGTANVVRWQRFGLPSKYTSTRGPLDPAGSGPVRHILASRAGTPPALIVERLLEPGWINREVPCGYVPRGPDLGGEIWQSPWLGDADWPIREQIHGFNRDAVDLDNSLTDVESDVVSGLKTAYPGVVTDSAQRTVKVLARCDALAGFFSRARHRAIQSNFALAGAAIVLFTLFAHPLHGSLGLLLGYLTCFMIALWNTYRVQRLRLEEKHLDYRALTEGLRVQLYWELAGIPRSVTEYYLRNQRTELAWIARAIRALCVKWGLPDTRKGAPIPEVLTAVKNAWVGSEMGFFSPRIQRMQRRRHVFERLSNVLFPLALIGATGLFVRMLYDSRALTALFEHAKAESLPIPFEWTIAALAILAVGAGFCRAIAEKMGYAAQIRRYEWMQGLHAQVDAAFEGAVRDDPEQMQKMLVELGRYALIENAEWLRIHREHPLEVPVGG